MILLTIPTLTVENPAKTKVEQQVIEGLDFILSHLKES